MISVATARCADQPRPICWVWPLHLSRRTADRTWCWTGLSAPLCTSWRWPLVAVLVGALPLACSFVFGLSGHQMTTALLTLPLLLAFARDDQFTRAVLFMALLFAAHSALAIAPSAFEPARVAGLMPDAAQYWSKQEQWIRTGQDPEYQTMNWLPAHLSLLGGVVLFSFTSLGLLPLWEGFKEVGMMNYYVGNLCVASHGQASALVYGWHVWSVLRGVAFTFIIFEVVSLSLERLCGRHLSTARSRAWRWGVGTRILRAR